LPSKEKDPKNFAKNVKRLQDFSSPRKWCTGGTAAETYLAKGDFWLYIENGEAKVAIRMLGDDSMVEIEGHNNTIPYQYWENVLKFIDKNNLPLKPGSVSYYTTREHPIHYKELLDAKEENIQFETNEIYRENYIAGLEITDYFKLSDKNKALLPEDSKTKIEDLFINKIERDFKAWNDVPVELKSKRLKAAVKDKVIAYVAQDPLNNYNSVKREFAYLPGVKEAGYQGFLNGLQNNPRIEIPDEFKTDQNIIEAQKRGWFELVESFPFEYENVPEVLRSDRDLQGIAIRSWEMARAEYPNQYAETPEVIKNAPDYIDLSSTVWNDIIKTNPYYLDRAPEHLKQELEPLALEGWKEKASNPVFYLSIPERMRSQLNLSDETKNNIIEYLKEQRIRDPNIIIPKELGRETEMMESHITESLEQTKIDPMNFGRLPTELQKNEELIASYQNLLRSKFETNPSEFFYPGKLYRALTTYTDESFQNEIANLDSIRQYEQNLIAEWTVAIRTNPRTDIRKAPPSIQETLRAIKAQASIDVAANWYKYSKITSELQRYK